MYLGAASGRLVYTWPKGSQHLAYTCIPRRPFISSSHLRHCSKCSQNRTFALPKASGLSKLKKGYKTSLFGQSTTRTLSATASPDKSGSKTSESTTKPESIRINIGEGIQPTKSVRSKTDYSKSYTANVYITPIRAMTEYLLDSGDFEGLEKIKRRSPYPEAEGISVFLREDVEKKSIAKWGSMEALQKERKRRTYFRRQTGSGRDNYGETTQKPLLLNMPEDRRLFMTGSGRVVLYAIVCNCANAVFKFGAWTMTGSHSMFSEFIHSVADTVNQVILAYGLQQSLKKPDPLHPYGWVQIRNVYSLISGVGIFCVGAGFSWYHGVQGILNPHDIEAYMWALGVLSVAFVTEGGTALAAIQQVKRGAQKAKLGMYEYLKNGNDPSTLVILLEDLAAVAGVVLAGGCMTASYYSGNPLYDAIGSIMVGNILAMVAGVIIWTNAKTLVGRSIPAEKRLELTQELEGDRMIRTLHDVKATVLGGQFVRFKAEVDFDGREIARCYLEKQDTDLLFKEIKKIDNVADMEEFLLKHGDGIVDTQGEEVDRIEKTLKRRHPEVRHVDLEQL